MNFGDSKESQNLEPNIRVHSVEFPASIWHDWPSGVTRSIQGHTGHAVYAASHTNITISLRKPARNVDFMLSKQSASQPGWLLGRVLKTLQVGPEYRPKGEGAKMEHSRVKENSKAVQLGIVLNGNSKGRQKVKSNGYQKLKMQNTFHQVAWVPFTTM